MMEMNSSPGNIASPALSPENDEYANAILIYDELATESVKRFKAFGEADAAFKNLQDTLMDQLNAGDSYWDKLVATTKGSTEHRAALRGLREATLGIHKTMDMHYKAIDDLGIAVSRAARGLARLSDGVAEVRDHASHVWAALEERIDEMRVVEPDLVSSRSNNSESRRAHRTTKDNHLKERRREQERERSPQRRTHSQERVPSTRSRV